MAWVSDGASIGICQEVKGAKSRGKGTEVSSSEGPEGKSEDAPANSGMMEKAPWFLLISLITWAQQSFPFQ